MDNSIQAAQEAFEANLCVSQQAIIGPRSCMSLASVASHSAVWRWWVVLQEGEKKVEVDVFLAEARSHDCSYLVVWDNGCGMDADRIQAFATYFLGQEDRGLAPRANDGEWASLSAQGRTGGCLLPSENCGAC